MIASLSTLARGEGEGMAAPRRKHEPIAAQLAEMAALQQLRRERPLTRAEHDRLELLEIRDDARRRRLPDRLERARRKLAQLEEQAA